MGHDLHIATMPTEVVTTRVTPAEKPPGLIEATPPPPLDAIDPADAEVLRFIGVTAHAKAVPDPFATPPESATSPAPAPSSPPDPAGGVAPSPAAPATPAATPTSPPASSQGAGTSAAPLTPPTQGEPAAGPLSKLSAAADKLNQAIDRMGRPAAPAAETPPAPTEDPEAVLRREALQSLSGSKKYPGRDLVAELDAFRPVYDAYRSKWISEHPGEKFDFDDEAHEAWREAHEPFVDESDLIRAEARIEARREASQVASERTREAEERAAAAQARLVAQEAPAKFVASFDAASVEALKAKDPALAFAVQQAIPAAAKVVETVHSVCRPGARPSPTDPNAQFVLGTVAFYEDQLTRMPAEQTTRDGRQFVPSGVYDRLTPTQKDACWTLRNEPALVETLATARLVQSTRQRADELRGWFNQPAAAPAAPAVPAAIPVPIIPATPPAPPAPVTTPAASPVAQPGAGGSGTSYFGF